MVARPSSRGAGKPTVIGMVHLLPLPGSPRGSLPLRRVQAAAVRDAETLAAAGVDGLMIENFGDAPFTAGRVEAETVAAVAVIAAAVRERTRLPLGINVLRNDARSALGVAVAVGARWIRVNVLTGARVTDQGIIEGDAAGLLRARAALGPAAAGVRILADTAVKHSAPLGNRPLEDEVADTIHRAHADGVIVSGSGTGKPVDQDHLRRVRAAAGRTPVWIGSGATAANIASLLRWADGVIVGTSLKRRGRPQAPVNARLAREFVQAASRGD